MRGFDHILAPTQLMVLSAAALVPPLARTAKAIGNVYQDESGARCAIGDLVKKGLLRRVHDDISLRKTDRVRYEITDAGVDAMKRSGEFYTVLGEDSLKAAQNVRKRPEPELPEPYT